MLGGSDPPPSIANVLRVAPPPGSKGPMTKPPSGGFSLFTTRWHRVRAQGGKVARTSYPRNLLWIPLPSQGKLEGAARHPHDFLKMLPHAHPRDKSQPNHRRIRRTHQLTLDTPRSRLRGQHGTRANTRLSYITHFQCDSTSIRSRPLSRTESRETRPPLPQNPSRSMLDMFTLKGGAGEFFLNGIEAAAAA